jgi:putative ABC transport system permease protein
MLGALVLAPAWSWPPRLLSRLRIATPIPDSSWGAAWENLARPAAIHQSAALDSLANAVAYLGAGALMVAAFALVLHTIGRVLAQWHGLTVRCALGARLGDLLTLLGRQSAGFALSGVAAGFVAGSGALLMLSFWWPALLTRPSLLLPALLAPLLAALAVAAVLSITVLPLAIGLQRRVRAVADLQGAHVTPRRGIVVAQNLLVVLQLAGLLVVVYGGGLIVRSSTLLEPDRPVPYSNTSTIASLTFAAAAPHAPGRADAFAAALASAHHGDTPLVAIASPGTWLGFGKSAPLLAFCYCSGIGGMLQPVVSARVRAAAVSPGALVLMAVAIIAGRDFTPADSAGAPQAVILSDVVARQMFGSWRRVVGMTVRPSVLPGSEYTVVGIARTPAPPGLGAGGAALPMAYFALLQHPPAAAELVTRAGARAHLGQAGWVERLRERGWSVGAPARLDARLRQSQAPLAWFGAIVLCLTVGAVLLALYALATLMSQSVAQRRREIAIRLALGARTHHIVRWTLLRALAITAAGFAIGGSAAGQLRQVLREHVRGTTSMDLVLLVEVMVLFGGLTLIASLLPVRRALAVDPAAAWSDAAQ